MSLSLFHEPRAPLASRAESTGAVLDGAYRYRLWRHWGPSDGRRVLFVMLNPSTADAFDDDATVRRCRGFARAWGYDGFLVGNLFAYRATKPRDLWSAASRDVDIVGPHNDHHLVEMTGGAALVVAAWGGHGARAFVRVGEVLALLGQRADVYALDRCEKSGHPRHPLFAPADLRPVLFRPRTKETP